MKNLNEYRAKSFNNRRDRSIFSRATFDIGPKIRINSIFDRRFKLEHTCNLILLWELLSLHSKPEIFLKYGKFTVNYDTRTADFFFTKYIHRVFYCAQNFKFIEN